MRVETAATPPQDVVDIGRASVLGPSLGPGSHRLRQLYFLFFVVSGACGLVYEVTWLRLAMANFGVTTPMISIVISVFMAGLGLGSWGGGVLARQLDTGSAAGSLRHYALLELLIGVSGIVVTPLLSWGRTLSEQIQNAMGLSSVSLYLVSGGLVAVVLLPWCTCMGATIPFVMSAMKKSLPRDGERSFSFLYLANVLGALLGTLVPAFVLFELLGFQRTLYLTATLNALLAATVLTVSRSNMVQASLGENAQQPVTKPPSSPGAGRKIHLYLLFLTGFVSMALEVVWVRQLTPYLGTVVYTLALILAFYLFGTFGGSSAYRAWDRARFPHKAISAWVVVGLSALASLISSDPRVMHGFGYEGAVLLAFLGIAPFSAVVGFLTPMLVDDWCKGDPERGGLAYGVNVLGCIIGPLFAGFCLLPWLGERWGTVALAAPLLLVGFGATVRPDRFGGAIASGRRTWGLAAAALAASVLVVAGTKDFASVFQHREVMRDYTATVIATGRGMRKRLLVNGVGITSLTPVTKMMAHVPLAFLSHRPRNGLVICFGMGTTFQSMLSWGIPTTGVELVPSVPALFGYFHPNGPKLLKSPLAHLVIDDGRRFLERTSQKYDVIVIDPPPPVQAAASSLLYSRQFYTLARKRLRPGGILAQWLPGGDTATQSSVAQALRDSFPFVRVFRSIQQGWGLHFLASESPIPNVTAAVLASRMPPAAVTNMLQWGPYSTAQKQLQAFLSEEIPIETLIARDPSVPALSDDHPVNEYYLLRRLLPRAWMNGRP